MATQVQFRGGTTVEHSTFTGASREITIDTTKDTVIVHDGTTAGGHPLATEDGATLTNVDINSGTIDGVTIGGSSAGAITGTTITGSSFVTTGDMTFGDNDKAIFGAGSDLQIYHDGSNSYIDDAGTGDLNIRADSLSLLNAAGSEYYARFFTNGAANFYHDGNLKLSTTSTGIDVTGNATFADNGKAIFGAGSDLQIYHDGTASYIADNGTGNLYMLGVVHVADSPDSNDGRILFGDATNAYGSVHYDFSAGDFLFENAWADAAADLVFRTNGVNTLTVSPTGIDVTGTAVVTGPNNVEYDSIVKAVSNNGTVSTSLSFGGLSGSSNLKFYTSDSVLRQRISSGGDISFYEDTGTTPKFFWDASAEALGIGTSSPAAMLDLRHNSASTHLRLTENTSGNWSAFGVDTSDNLRIYVNNSERMRIDSSGNVGIGLTPSSGGGVLQISGGLRIAGSASASDTTAPYLFRTSGVNNMVFATEGSERMRIDSSGNLLVGTTSVSVSNDGIVLGANDQVIATRNGGAPLWLNRKSSDGDIALFNKDGTTVGSIASKDGDLAIGTGDTGFRFIDGSDAIIPQDISTNSGRDNAIDLGNSGARFDDIYATNGTIQTSDRNEKQDIAELDEAEKRVAIAAKGLIRKYRWKDAVAEKGDDARIHVGIIAQDLQDAFAAEGLDAGRYAMFIHSTWTDEETGEEKSRMGVRYSELLAFIIAAI